MSDRSRMTYKEAGVDIEAGNRFVDLIKPLVKATSRPEVLTDIGGFGGLFKLHTQKYTGARLRHRRCRHQAEAGL